jgi:TRAP transporter 4TM/12TM fusion protein
LRKLKGTTAKVTAIYCILASLFHLYTASFGILESFYQRGIHLLFFFPLAFILYPATKKSPQEKITIMDFCLAFLAFVSIMYVILNEPSINTRFSFVDPVNNIELILGTIAVVLILEASRRAVCKEMAIIVGLFVLYTFICQYMPGLLYHKAYSFKKIVEMFYLMKNVGIFGNLTGISATFIVLFIIFGSFLRFSKIGDFFFLFANKIAGSTTGGPAKIAVISSALFGSISGSSTANVFTTGNFTIPLMKSLDYDPIFAGAVEASASTGGLIMPPIMGVGAFVMAEITGIPYIVICKAAIVPAIFYYLGILFAVHLESLKIGLLPLPKNQKPSWSQIFKRSHLLIVVFVLVYLLIKGFSPFMAAFYSILISIPVSFLNKETWLTPKKILLALKDGAETTVMIAIACVAAGIISAVLSFTGLASVFTSLIVSLSGGNLFIILILTMLTTIILGMGLPCTPAYIIAISVTLPTLTKLGMNLLPSHLFVYYYAILASVTPPVAMAAYAAASISGSDPIKTGFKSFNLAIVGFIVPLVFIFNNALLLLCSINSIILSIFVVLFAIVCLVFGIEGYMFTNLTLIMRALLGVSSTISVLVAAEKLPFFWIFIAIIIAIFVMILNFKNREMISKGPLINQ